MKPNIKHIEKIPPDGHRLGGSRRDRKCRRSNVSQALHRRDVRQCAACPSLPRVGNRADLPPSGQWGYSIDPERTSRWGVDTTYVSIEDDGSTPVIVQTIRPNPGGDPTHTFSWRCPYCGTRFPGYKPALAATAETIAVAMPSRRYSSLTASTGDQSFLHGVRPNLGRWSCSNPLLSAIHLFSRKLGRLPHRQVFSHAIDRLARWNRVRQEYAPPDRDARRRWLAVSDSVQAKS